MLQTTGAVESQPAHIIPNVPADAPSQTHQPIDFDAEVNLFHFNLLRCVGKGAFGKVCIGLLWGGGLFPRTHPRQRRSESFSTSRRRISTPSNTSTRPVASSRKPSQISSRREGCSKRSVATLEKTPSACCSHLSVFNSHNPLSYSLLDRSPIYRQPALCLPRRRKLLFRARPHAWR